MLVSLCKKFETKGAFIYQSWPDRDSCQDDENKVTLLKGQSPFVKTSWVKTQNYHDKRKEIEEE